jgi:PAS domain S-box-containing protein
MALAESPEALAAPPIPDVGFAWVIVEHAPDGILVSDNDGRIVMANRQVETLFGYDRDSIVGAPVETLLPERLRRAHGTNRARYANAPALRPMGTGLELFGRRADGSEFPIEVSLSPTATDSGPATVVIIRDVTHQRALERAAQAAVALDRNERDASELHDRVISHLFGSAMGLASVLGRNRLDEEDKRRLQDVIEELDTAVRTIRQTVFARLERELGIKQPT